MKEIFKLQKKKTKKSQVHRDPTSFEILAHKIKFFEFR